MNLIKKTIIGISLLSVIGSSCSRNSLPSRTDDKIPNTIALQWNEAAFVAEGGTTYQHTLFAARVNAMMHLAMHDALNTIKPVYQQYAFKKYFADADPNTAASTAAHTVLLSIFPDKKQMLDSLLSVTTAQAAEGTRKMNAITIGKEAAEKILSLRLGDGADADPIGIIEPSVKPGEYNVVPPFNFVFAPSWKTMKTFGIEKADQFRCVPPPALNSELYTNDFNEVKETGKLNSTTRTAEQTSYSKFWYEFSEIGWNRVARNVAKNNDADLYETARMLALVNMGLIDAYIGGWDSKFHYNFWRPFTAIRAAAQDGNDNTTADLQWEPSEPTPPVQDYPSTHSALGNAAATIIEKCFSGNTEFTMTSFTSAPAGTTRSFTNALKAADENADSRVRAGIHFRFSCKAGQELGNQIGTWIFDHHLRPIN